MPFTKTIKTVLFICLAWAIALGLSSCAPVRVTKDDIHDLQMSAQRGDAKSRVYISERYEFGAGVPANSMIAAQWYQLAAKQDDPEAQFYLGVMYERGNGLYRNSAESMKWLFKSAEQGQEKAAIWLGGLYLKDKALGQEFSKRLRRYRQSANNGNAGAQYALGWIYREGVGVQANPREALKWYSKAAGQGNAKAELALGDIYLAGKVAPANPGEALAWYRKSADAEIQAQVKLWKLYTGEGGLPENAGEANRWSKTIAQNTDASLRACIDRQHATITSEKEKHPALAIRACQRISAVDPHYRNVSKTCDALTKQMSEKLNPRISEAESALEQKDWDRFRGLLAGLMTPDFDYEQLRQIIASAWRLIEEETRATEKTAQELLRSLETAERSTAYRKKNARQISKLIMTFKTTVDQGLRNNPEDAALLALAQKGKKVIASLQQKIKPSRPAEEKVTADVPEELRDEIDPGEEEHKKAVALFNNGRFAEAEIFFEKTTKIRESRYIASSYMYLGIGQLARINPANINEARKRHLKGLSSFQNALRFDSGITLPAGYDKYQPEFNEAKERLR